MERGRKPLFQPDLAICEDIARSQFFGSEKWWFFQVVSSIRRNSCLENIISYRKAYALPPFLHFCTQVEHPTPNGTSTSTEFRSLLFIF